MVLEHLFPEKWLERKSGYGFLLGAGYSIVAILIARILFPSDPALVAVAFTAILILPELYKMMSIEERVEDKEKRFTWGKLFKDNWHLFRTYLAIAGGIFIVYAVAAVILPSMSVNHLFEQQIAMRYDAGSAVAGRAFSSAGEALAMSGKLFWDILLNNWWVMLACFIISLLTGDGAIFLITWNASVWGTIFGVTARNAAVFTNANPIFYLLLVLVIVLPHAIIEISSYIIASISGGVISKDVLLEKFESSRFNIVFTYNVRLFLIAIAVLILGALVETLVLDNVTIYHRIIEQSYLAIR